MRAPLIWTALAVSLGLSACGGGDDDASSLKAVRAITVFGDSLSDVGSYAPATGDPANLGKFTVNPGKVWVENIADHYGLKLTPNRALTLDKDASGGATTAVGTATVLGGNGYAEGGARVVDLPSQSGVGNNQLVAPVTAQLDRYLAQHSRFADDTLVVIGGGGNDAYAQFSAVCWGTDENGLGLGNTSMAAATAAIEKAANTQVANVKRIQDKGASVILVYSSSDWSRNPFARKYLSPEYQATGCYTPVPAAQVTAWVKRFNQILQDGIAGVPGVVLVDTTATFADALDNPARHGFTNVSEPACANAKPTTSATFCTGATLVAPGADQTYFWSDNFHPTPRGHQVLSDRALQLLKPITG